MSAKETHQIVEKIRDETVCCICIETFNDPRLLPCNHTFCLECLTASVMALEWEPEEANEEMKQSLLKASRYPCPVCRQDFTIPDQGLSDLPKNFFMIRLIDITLASNTISAQGTGSLCDTCTESADSYSATAEVLAEGYCVDCRQKLCKKCIIHHKKNKMTKLHHIVSGETERDADALDDAVLQVCEEHRGEHLIYCEDCREAVCPLCFVEKHSLHKGKDAKKFIEKCRKQVDSQICDLSELISQSYTRQEMVKEKKEEFSEAIGKMKEAVFEAGKREKERIDRLLDSVQRKTDMIKWNGLEEITALEVSLDNHLDELEGYLSYCKKMKSNVTMRDVTETLSNISDAANQMKKEHQLQIDRQIPKPEIAEYESWLNSLQCSKANVVDVYGDSPVLLRRFRTRAVSRDFLAIRGIALLGNELSVVHSNSQCVTVYNAVTISFKYEYNILAIRNPIDLTSCKKNNCLYILDEQQQNESYYILKVNDGTSCGWDTGRSSGSLIISVCGNVILAIEKTAHLKEYTPGGYLLREIVCDPSSSHGIRHGVQQRADMFLMCFSNGNYNHGLCLLDVDRKTIVEQRSDLGLLLPVCLALDEAQNVLVVDQGKKRVVVLCSSSLSFKRELLTVEHGLEVPQKILLDELRGRLFVLDGFGRILVFNVKVKHGSN